MGGLTGGVVDGWRERDSLGLPLGDGGGAAGGSSVVREGGFTYAVKAGDSELAYEVDDVCTSTMRLVGLVQRLKANQAGAGGAFVACLSSRPSALDSSGRAPESCG